MTADTDRRVPRPTHAERALATVQTSFSLVSAEGWKFATFGTQAEVNFALRKLSGIWIDAYIVDLGIAEGGVTLEIRPVYATQIDDAWFTCDDPGNLALMAKAERTHFMVFPTFKAARDYAASSLSAFADSL